MEIAAAWRFEVRPEHELQEAVRKARVHNKEVIDSAVLAVEQPQNNVKDAFQGGQNGRDLGAPHLLAGLFKWDRKDQDDKSWLDRVTDSLLDKLELNWEDNEEARLDVSAPTPSFSFISPQAQHSICRYVSFCSFFFCQIGWGKRSTPRVVADHKMCLGLLYWSSSRLPVSYTSNEA